jgi:20S proteasome subunit alpha 6
LDEIYGTEEASDSIPPLHRHFVPLANEDTTNEDTTSTGLRLNVYLNKKNPLSVPRWCRNNSADEWLYEQFGSKHSAWKAKLVVMDPDPPPTLASILENWSSSSNLSSSQRRNTFISTLLSDPHDLLEILLRLTRGDRNPPAPAPLANTIRADSPYATHQTHVSLAILAMYRLTTDYAVQAGVDLESVNEKIGDIIKSLPTNLIGRSLDGMFKEWDGRKK